MGTPHHAEWTRQWAGGPGTDSTSYILCSHVLSPWPSPCLAPGPNHAHPLKPSSSPETLLDCLAPSPSPGFTHFTWVFAQTLSGTAKGQEVFLTGSTAGQEALEKYRARVCLGLVHGGAKSVTSVRVCPISPLCPLWVSALALASPPCSRHGSCPSS